jgi:hypothetical protein
VIKPVAIICVRVEGSKCETGLKEEWRNWLTYGGSNWGKSNQFRNENVITLRNPKITYHC